MLKSPKSFGGLMFRKAMAFFLAYSFCASSMWSLTGQDLHVAQSTAGMKMNWNVAETAKKAQNALATSALNSAGLLAPNAATTSPAIAASSILSAAGTAAATPFDGGSSSCTVHTTQPSSDSDDGDNGYSTYARHDYKYGSTDQASGITPAVVASGVTIFGPQTFVRTTGPPNEFDSTITVPAWIAQPFYLHVVNGDSSGNHRVSSATVSINGVALLVPSDFNQQVASADCAVNLTVPTSALHVELASKPGSFLTINLLGQNQDHTPPTLSVTAPADGSTVNTTTPHIALSYSDVKGATEPAASGVNVPSLKVLLDGVDRTSLFTERPNDASADVPSSLALSQGPHTITASIQDNAGNTATATSQFQVVTQSGLVLQIVQPAAGAFLNSLTVPVQITYSDNVSINTSTLKVTVNGVDRTSAFTVTASGATGTVTGQQGANQIVASISDVSSQQATASAAFNIDTVPPVLTIQAPPPGSTHGSSTVAYSVQYSDDQALDLTSLKISVDGTALPVTPGPSSASGTVALADGAHTLTALIKDKTGNQTTASSTFSVDTTAPSIHIVQPTPGAIQNVATLQVQVTYGDNENINTGSLKIAIDGVDETSFFTVTATGASASLAGPFAEGSHTLTAQIADQTGNVGQASSTFVVDTIKPALTIVSPVGPINTASPTALAQYSDSGTGINTSSVHVFVDGSDVTSGFSVGNASVTGTVTGLSEGTHQFRVTVADRAGNVADQSVSFLVDVTPPAVSFTSPANNVFINNTQPSVTLTYSDSGSGINQNSIHIFLQAGSNPESEITSAFTLGASQANGTIGTPTPLAPGTYHLRAQVVDNAGNSSTATSAFQVDTQPPTYVIQLPAANSFLNTATPALLVTYQDDASGVDPSQFAIRVDGIDRTNRLTVTATSASGTLLPADALADGTHQVEVTVVDRAGNSAPVVPQSFLVDTTPPTISISTPVNGGFTNNNLFPISVSYADSGSGIDVTKFQLTIDGVDQTAQFTITPTGATGTPAAILPNGLHTVTAIIKDLAGNPATATAAIAVNTVPPQITITQPANGVFTNATSLVVTGTVVDAVPVTVTVAGTTVPVQNGSFTSAGITLGTNATQTIPVVATDAAGNSSTVTLTINIDRTPPTITGVINPPPNAAGWNNTAVTVTFTCSDSGSGVATCPAPVPVTAEGANQQVTGTAVDNAGNVAQATVTVNIDKTPPVITATPAPAPNAANWNTTDVTITYMCSDNLSGVALCPAPRVVTTEGKAQPITVTVSDIAGNTATSTVLLNIEKTAPTITASFAPPANAAGWNNSNVIVSFLCTPSASDIVSCQAPISVTTEGKNQVVSGTVTDQSGKSNTATATVNIDKTPPLISASTAPPPNAAGWNNTNVVISYLCSDSLSGVSICPTPVTVSTEGAAESFTAQATDQAGNTAGVTTTLNIDKTPPVVTATAAPPPNGNGWNNTNVTVTFSCTDSLSGVANCPAQQLVASEGQNQNIPGQATDVAGNVATGSITLNIDKTPPTIVQLSTPDHVSRLHAGQISVTVNDNFTVSQVVISVNGTSLGAFTTAPYQAALQVPAGANPGDTLTVTVQATDEAGNTQTASHAVRVAADGVIVGQVLSDATSFPIQGAVVQTISTTAASDQTDDHGRYSLLASDSHLFLSASSASPATTTVEREVFVQDGVGTVPVDARLTPLAAPMAIGSAGGTLTAGNISLTVPAGAVGDGTTFQLTPLTGQGLPGLLPLGWSPLAAFDFRASSSAMNLSATVSQLPNIVLHLATYNPALHAWTMVATNLQVVSGGVALVLPSSGAYVLVVPDVVIPPITIPNPGSALTGIAMQLLDPAASSSGSLSPAILPPTGGTSTATLGVQTTAAVPSGTVIQANVSEKFSLTSGDVVSEENRSEDIVIYNALAPANSTLGAQFAVTPSQKYTNAQLLTGKVHLDILAGREGVRGQPGGSDPVTLTDGIATLAVPGGALSQDTAINVQGISLEDFVPTNGSIGALQEVLVDFSGETLNTPGQLSISSNGLNPAHTFFLTQVQRIDGIPHIVLVALAQINGSSLTSVATPGLPGITQGGEYVFYDVSAPVGFVQGIVSSSAGPVQALVQTDSLPVVSITGANGLYIVPAIAGTANLKASSPHTNLTGSVSVQLTAGQTTQANIVLAGTVTSAVVAPADGTLGVPVSTTITITTTAALNPQSITQANLVLVQGTASSGTPVPVGPFVLSSSGTVLSFAPVSNLNPATQYTIQVAGLADTFGGAVVVPVSSFTTKAVAALNFNPNAITFSFPDANGNIQITAPAGSLPPGTQVLMVDQTNGLVLTLTALNDGSVSGSFVGTINDVLQLTITDPNGATTSFTRSQFVAADGTTAVGAGGGTVTGPGNTAVIIPEGALTTGTTFKLTLLDQTAFPQLPSWSGLNFGSGLHIDAPSMPVFNKEAKLAFPVPPNAPPNAFYYVYRRLTDQNGNTYFETIDHAFVQGTGANAQVVTASPPFCGYHNAYGNINTAIAASGAAAFIPQSTPFQDFILMWDILQADPNLPGIASPGLIVGQVLQIAPSVSGQTTTTFQQDPGPITIFLDSDRSHLAIYDGKCSTFSLFDPRLGGGSRNITATDGTTTLHQVANEVNGIQVDDATYLIYVGLEHQYRNIGRVTFTFPPPTPPPPPPQVDIRMFTLNSDGVRVPAGGIVQVGNPLVIALKTALTVTSGNIGGLQLSAVAPDHLDSIKDTQPPLDARVYDPSSANQTYTPTTPGTYTLTVTALSPTGGPVIHVSKSFLVVTAGNNNTQPTPGQAPTVIAYSPQILAKRVPVTIFPSATFSEPVTNVAGNVTLTDSNGNSPRFTLVGIRPDGSVANPVSSSDVITAVTLQPLTALEFSTNYNFTITFAVVDQSNPPQHIALAPFTIPFTTVGPQKIDTSDQRYSSTRPLIIGERAYIGEPANASLSSLNVVNIADPTSPGPPTPTNYFVGRVTDIAGQETSPIMRCLTEQLPGVNCPMQGSGGPLVALSATIGATDLVIPSNIWFYDVSDPDVPKRVGAVSATTSATQDGSVLRIFMKDQFVYTATAFKGLQVIDIQQAINEFQATPANQFGGAITTEGNGFALDAVVNTIPVSLPLQGAVGSVTTFQALMLDVKAADYPTAAPDPSNPSAPVPTHTYIVATGRLPLVVADPQQSSLNAVVFPAQDSTNSFLQDNPLIDGTTGSFKMTQGTALALGSVPLIDALGNAVNQPVAVVVGYGNSGPMLGVINMTDPTHPQTQGFVSLVDKLKRQVGPVDVILKDSLAVVGTSLNEVLLVDLTDPRNPFVAGEIDGNSLGANQVLGDRLALTSDGVLITSSFNSLIGGIHAAIFGSQCASLRATLAKSPPSQNSFQNVTVPQFSWKVSGGFNQQPEGVALNHDGLVLNDIFLGRRQMARAMSIPYFYLQRGQGSTSGLLRCMLYTSNDNACTGVAPGVSARSHLLKYSPAPNVFSDHFEYKAQYLIDYLDGNPDINPDVPDSCVLFTQQYEFYKEGLKPLEPFGFFPSALFQPLVKYSYYTDAGGPQLNFLQAPQRLHLDARTPDQPTPTIASHKAAANDVMLACDVETTSSACGLTPPPLDSTILENIHFLGMLHNQSPSTVEEYLSIIQNGQNSVLNDPVPRINAAGMLSLTTNAISLQLDLEQLEAGGVTVSGLISTVADFVKTIESLTAAFQPIALPQFNTTILDNFHQNPTPSGNPTQPPDEPTATAFGCPACVHVHWRWSKDLTSSSPLSIIAHIDPNFDNNNGNLRIPPKSNQDVDITILRAGGQAEQQPTDVFGLFTAQKQQLPLGPSIDARDLVNSGTTPVFWYIGKGHQNSETFFYHGLGFGTFYANRISLPTPGVSPLTVNVEHTRTVNYTIRVSRLRNLGSTLFPIPSFDAFGPFTGTLPAGTDDIPNPGTDLSQWFASNVNFDGSTIVMWVTVQLDDPELQTTVPKFEWKKTFTFTPGDVVDPTTGYIIREP